MSAKRLESLIESVLRTAEEIELYGNFAELQSCLRRHEFDAALELVSSIRLRDNRPVVRSFKSTFQLRHNEHRLMGLESQIVKLLQLAEPAIGQV